MPELYIITGSNGAGKSTVGTTYLPIHIQQNCSVFDGDKLFMDKQRELWKSGIKAIKEAKKMAFAFVEECFDKLVEESLSGRSDFAYEDAILPTKQPRTYHENSKLQGLLYT
jgi:predicted ABC-type ATPase